MSVITEFQSDAISASLLEIFNATRITSAPITCIDDRHAAVVAALEVVHQIGARLGEARDRRAHDHQVEVAAEHPDRVEAGFALGLRRGGRIANLVAGHSQNLAGRHE